MINEVGNMYNTILEKSKNDSNYLESDKEYIYSCAVVGSYIIDAMGMPAQWYKAEKLNFSKINNMEILRSKIKDLIKKNIDRVEKNEQIKVLATLIMGYEVETKNNRINGELWEYFNIGILQADQFKKH